jgi:hypothetical protein
VGRKLILKRIRLAVNEFEEVAIQNLIQNIYVKEVPLIS